MSDEAKKGTTPIHLHTPPNLQVVPVSGAFGGFGPNELFRVNFYYDDISVKFGLSDGKETLDSQGIQRDMQARMVMNPQTAASITLWMVRSLMERGVLKPEHLQELIAPQKGN